MDKKDFIDACNSLFPKFEWEKLDADQKYVVREFLNMVCEYEDNHIMKEGVRE